MTHTGRRGKRRDGTRGRGVASNVCGGLCGHDRALAARRRLADCRAGGAPRPARASSGGRVRRALARAAAPVAAQPLPDVQNGRARGRRDGARACASVGGARGCPRRSANARRGHRRTHRGRQPSRLRDAPALRRGQRRGAVQSMVGAFSERACAVNPHRGRAGRLLAPPAPPSRASVSPCLTPAWTYSDPP